MVETNPTGKPQNDAQKPGLSWTQPAQNVSQQKIVRPESASAKPTGANPTSRVIGIIVGVIIILALAAWGIAALRNRSSLTGAPAGTATSTRETATPSTTGAQPSSTGSVVNAASESYTVPSPQDAGVSVSVTDMKLSQPTWLIVYESRNGKPGNILGAGLFFAGDTSASVPLMRSTSAGQTYFVTAAIDNGDHLFSAKDETPVVGADGQQVWTTFETR